MAERANKLMLDQNSMNDENEVKDTKDTKKNKKAQVVAAKSKPESSMSLEVPKTPDLNSIEKG
jgi:hypothetical protein